MFSAEEIQTNIVSSFNITTKAWSQEHLSIDSGTSSTRTHQVVRVKWGKGKGKGRLNEQGWHQEHSSSKPPPHTHTPTDLGMWFLTFLMTPNAQCRGSCMLWGRVSFPGWRHFAVSTKPDVTHSGTISIWTLSFFVSLIPSSGSLWQIWCGKSHIIASRATALKNSKQYTTRLRHIQSALLSNSSERKNYK